LHGLKCASFKREFEKRRGTMTRPSDFTRGRILKAAESLFAERGYKDTSVRAVVAKARVNQAAINYHFAGKDGLYREVLRAAIRALTEHQLAQAEELRKMSRENALAEFIKYELRPLAARDQISAECTSTCQTRRFLRSVARRSSVPTGTEVQFSDGQVCTVWDRGSRSVSAGPRRVRDA